MQSCETEVEFTHKVTKIMKVHNDTVKQVLKSAFREARTRV